MAMKDTSRTPSAGNRPALGFALVVGLSLLVGAEPGLPASVQEGFVVYLIVQGGGLFEHLKISDHPYALTGEFLIGANAHTGTPLPPERSVLSGYTFRFVPEGKTAGCTFYLPARFRSDISLDRMREIIHPAVQGMGELMATWGKPEDRGALRKQGLLFDGKWINASLYTYPVPMDWAGYVRALEEKERHHHWFYFEKGEPGTPPTAARMREVVQEGFPWLGGLAFVWGEMDPPATFGHGNEWQDATCPDLLPAALEDSILLPILFPDRDLPTLIPVSP